MSDRHFVGLELTGFQDNGSMRPVSRVTLMLDDENVITAGDNTGLEITASCPHATQAMVDSILDRLKGYQYRAFSAEAASLDPAAELGDGITVSGIYSTISRLDDDGSGYPGITAPGEAELEDEYPSAGPYTQEFNRKLAQTRSSITKTAEEIRLEVSSTINSMSAAISVALDSITQRVEGLDEKYAEVKLTIDGLTITGPDGVTRIKGSSIETGSIAAGSIRADQVQLTGAITFGDLSVDVYNQIASGITAQEAKTLINSTLVSSPNIAGGKFWNVQQNNYLIMEEQVTTTGNARSYIGHYSTLYGSDPVMLMGAVRNASRWTWVLAPFNFPMLEYSGNAYGGTIYPYGTWDFSYATINGLSGATAVFA